MRSFRHLEEWSDASDFRELLSTQKINSSEKLVQYNFYLHFSYEISLKFCETNATEKFKKNVLEVYFTFTTYWFKLFVLDYIYPSSFIHTFSTHLVLSHDSASLKEKNWFLLYI